MQSTTCVIDAACGVGALCRSLERTPCFDKVALARRWVVASDAEAAQKIAEEKFPGKVKGLSQASNMLLP